jgi:hypothetical protein
LKSARSHSDTDVIDAALHAVSDSYCGLELVRMPPDWRGGPGPLFSVALFDGALSAEELTAVLAEAQRLGLPNPRALSRPVVELASLCHPLLHARIAGSRAAPARLRTVEPAVRPESERQPASLEYYIQSLLFLAGCTLTPAIVQGRFSAGTIQSKLMRLWQTAHYAQRFDLAGLRELSLDRFVADTDAAGAPSIEALVAIKRVYGRALSALAGGTAAAPLLLRAERLGAAERERFGFVRDLRRELGANLECAIAYGSSVTSAEFADYDVLLVTHDSGEALRALAGRRPRHQGKEVNLGVYGRSEFAAFQTASGDNLDGAALCIHGEAEVPIKPVPDLLVRNVSFGFIRLRQLLGLCGSLAREPARPVDPGDASLYEYFMKIPMHVMKGIRAAVGEPVAKEVVNEWTTRALGYDIDRQLALLRTGRLVEAAARACCATEAMLLRLGSDYGIFESVEPRDEEGARDEHRTHATVA